MNKLFILLISLFGASFFFKGNQAQTTPTEISKGCFIGYYAIPAPPECTTTIGPDGKPAKACTYGSSGLHAAVLDENMKSFSQSDYVFSDLYWIGYCHCTLYVYSKINFKGYSKSYPFSKSAIAKEIYANKIWKRKTNSFKIECAF